MLMISLRLLQYITHNGVLGASLYHVVAPPGELTFDKVSQ